ncbi:MAG: hypothetical protein ABI205_01840 [Gemmatimonadaceae bacterium]
MTGDALDIGIRDENAAQLVATWNSMRRPHDGPDRTSLAAAFCTALRSELDGGVNVAAAAAAFGAAYAASGGTQNSLVADLDSLEAALFERLFERAEPTSTEVRTLAARTRRVHALAALARRSAAAAFGHSIAVLARERARIARPDIANAIGTVRNAIVLMEDATVDTAREHFRAIAKRNSSRSETLVRSHLSDRAALNAALGWNEVSLSDLSNGPGAPTGADRVYMNVGALETIIDAIRSFGGCAESECNDPVPMSFTATTATTGVLTVQVPMCADRAADLRALESFRHLAAAIGLSLENDSSLDALRFALPLSAGNERHDFAGASQGDHADAVAL